jgi:uncharacterized protein (DUF2336 family)
MSQLEQMAIGQKLFHEPAPSQSGAGQPATGQPATGPLVMVQDGDPSLRDVRTATETVRVRLGAGAQTSPAVLYALASDPSVTVRAAVAMNAQAPTQVDGLLTRDGDERVRALLARKLATLGPGMSAPDRGALQQSAYDMLALLVSDEAVRVRAAITAVVQDMPGVPRELILRLARDAAVPVSDPVIRLSPMLTPADLLALIAAPSSPAMTVSVAGRSGLNEEVSDAIAGSANTAAITALLANKSAAIREATLDALVSRAAEHTEWHEPLVRRPLLPARAARALSEIVATHLLQVLSERADLSQELTQEISHRLERNLALRDARPLAAPDMTSAQALEAALALSAAGALSEDALMGAAQRGEVRFAAALLAVAAEVSLPVVDRAVSLRSAKGLVSLIWKAGFSMRVAGPLQALLARLPPAAMLPAGLGGSFPLATEEMRWQVDFLSRVGR